MDQSELSVGTNNGLKTKNFVACIRDQLPLHFIAAAGLAPARLSKPIQFNEGRVGVFFEKENVLLTSPNSLYITSPLMGLRHVRMRKDLHFGEEDPLFFPQPYTPGIGHLSVIPIRTSEPNNPHSPAWTAPSPSDFEQAP
ncbi:hypothetical protein AAF712_015863 [Marasmius tenuissimus]|uniref:Uncharacterized protein n=1 Tax=Marasmius tenuissimus TaxID=585030 RepID=A0ABR2Z878_9AGAR